MCKEIKTVNAPAVIGEYAGFKLAVSFDSFNHKFVMNIKGLLSHNLEIGSEPLGNIARINHALESMTKELAEATTKLENVEHQLETAKVEVTKPFAQEVELTEKLERVADKPVQRISLKERLAEMQIRAAGGSIEKRLTQKLKGTEVSM